MSIGMVYVGFRITFQNMFFVCGWRFLISCQYKTELLNDVRPMILLFVHYVPYVRMTIRICSLNVTSPLKCGVVFGKILGIFDDRWDIVLADLAHRQWRPGDTRKNLLFATTVYFIWQERNRRLFRGSRRDIK